MVKKGLFYLFGAIVAVAALGAAACGGDDDDDEDAADTVEEAEDDAEEEADDDGTEAAGGASVELELEALNESGVSGIATLTDNGDGTTTVLLETEGDDQETPHPAHIHLDPGECLEAADIIAQLTNVEGGTSTTDVELPLADIQAAEHVIIIHESEENIGNYIACAEIPTA